MRELLIVTGLPRSGTSLVMSMLGAGGVPVLSDDQRPADEHNPRGYFEHSRLLLEPDGEWLRPFGGSAIKILYRQLEKLPADLDARVLLVERNLHEVVASQQRMRPDPTLDWVDVFAREMRRFKGWLARRTWPVLRIEHGRFLSDCSAQLSQIQEFVPIRLDLAAMAAQVDPGLYRCRSC